MTTQVDDTTTSTDTTTTDTTKTKTPVLASDLPEEALKAKLEKATAKGKDDAVKELAARLGMSVEDAETKLAAAKKLEDEQKSELQRVTERAEALAPRATRADALERRVKALSEQEYADLSDDMKGVVDDLANDADGNPDHDKRIDVIVSLRKRGMLGKKAAVLPDGANTSTAKPAPKTETKVEPDSPEGHFQKWEGIQSSVLKAAYWNDHHGQIREAAAYKSKHGN